jgi:hypothetical protein
MPLMTRPVSASGPVIDVQIGVPPAQMLALQQAGKTPPNELQLHALVDPGSSHTCIDLQCVTALGLVSVGQVPLFIPAPQAASQQYNQYHVRLWLIHPQMNYYMSKVDVVAADLYAQGVEMLLGRDVLKHCLLVYDGPSDTFSFGF